VEKKKLVDSLKQRLTTLLKSSYDYERPKRGEVRKATILSIGEDDLIVDLDAKRDGIVSSKDLALVDEDYRASLEVGDRIPVLVLGGSQRHSGLVVSLNKGLQRKDWLRAQDLLDSGRIIELEVVDVNRGGVLVSFGRLRGFVPNSHLTAVPRGMRGQRLKEAKSDLVGQTLPLVVIEVIQRRRRLILSQRVANGRQRQQLLEELDAGQVRSGVVRNLVDFGAFVDLGGVDGLIHISELGWKYVTHPREVLEVGDKIEVYVLKVDRERERIGLSRKRLLPDPWYQVVENLFPDDVVEGTITNVVPFGAFVHLDQGIEGLVHTSEIPGGDDARANLEPGAPVAVRILAIDEGQRHISLRLVEQIQFRDEEKQDDEMVESNTLLQSEQVNQDVA
jgi:small subunit ribosomal protein S1